MTPFPAHLVFPLAADIAAYLRAALDENIHLTIEDETPPPANLRALVSGRPSADQLRSYPGLELLLIPFAGLPAVTREVLSDFPGLPVYSVHHNTEATAEMALTLMMACARNIIPAHNTFRHNDWSPRYNQRETSVLLAGQTALILGYGRIGRRVGAVCRALGMEVLGVRRAPSDAPDEFTLADLPDLLPRANVVVITLPGTPETENLLGADQLAALPDRAILVNVGRAAVVDEAALYAALTEGTMHAAGLDVWYSYPRGDAMSEKDDYAPSSQPFGDLDNVVISPHRAGGLGIIAVELARMDGIAAALNAAARGEPIPNPVNIAAGY
jgi:phosphoglycerate dehydrogenase-like enzyme